MFNIEITPLVKTEIRPVPEAQLLDQLYRIFLDKGVHFRVEQVNDESIIFYWTHCNDYLCDAIAKEIGELLNPVAENTWVEPTETEQPKVEEQQKDEPHVLWYEGKKIKEIKEALETLYPDDLGIYSDNDKIVVRLKKDDRNLMEEISSIVKLIDNDAVRLISIHGIGKDTADELMRVAVHEHKEKIHQSVYKGETLTVLIDNDVEVFKSLTNFLRIVSTDSYIEKARALVLEKLFNIYNKDCDCPNCQKRR
ncbi:hypothetical protein ABO35_000505 [Salmonella enterica subsp. enterica serovar Braenderup]|nr:hypothetical protein [Salmonella enterica subsp. enterica serovar Braenderup]